MRIKSILSCGGGGATKSVLYFCGIFIGFLLILNALFPTQSDDLGAVAEGFKGAWRSYINWNGRSFEMLRVAFVGALAPSAYFVIINTFVGFAFIMGFFVFIFGRLPRDFNDVIMLCILCFIIMYQGAFGSIFLWAAGSLNYLWAYCVLVYSFIPYRLFWKHYFAGQSPKHTALSVQIAQSFGFMILCFVAGMSSEMVGIVAIIVHIGFMLYGFYKRVKLPMWYFAGVLGLMLGWLALYLSPGHAARMAVWWKLFGRDSIYTLGDILAMSLPEQIKHLSKTYRAFIYLTAYMLAIPLALVLFERYRAGVRFYKLCLIAIVATLFLIFAKHHLHISFLQSYDIYGIVHFALLFLFFAYMIYFYHTRGQKDMKALFIKLLAAFVIYALLVGTTIQVGIPPRARLAYVLVMAVMILFTYQQYIAMLRSAKVKTYIQIAFIALTCGYGAYVMSAYIDGRLKWEAMLDSIAEQKAAGRDEIIVKANTFTSFYRQYGDWGNPTDNPNEWPNTSYAHYFGVKRFMIE